MQNAIIEPSDAAYNPWTRGPHDVEADWILMSTCNYRCIYCFWDTEALGRKISPPASVETLAAFFEATGLRWLLHLTGGEPFHYPDFLELCGLLTRQQVISINTNADSDRVLRFADTIDPGRVDFINCGVHLQQRVERGRVDQFIRNFHALRGAGFDVFASCVMYPELFATFPEVWAWWAEQGIPLIPKALQGWHLGRAYPEGYTDHEQAMFFEYSGNANLAYANRFPHRTAPPTINPLNDAAIFFSGPTDYRGQLCEAGRHFVRIRENGEIRRCGPEDVIGNIVEGWFDRRTGPSLCTELECPYFCDKYRVRTGSQE